MSTRAASMLLSISLPWKIHVNFMSSLRTKENLSKEKKIYCHNRHAIAKESSQLFPPWDCTNDNYSAKSTLSRSLPTMLTRRKTSFYWCQVLYTTVAKRGSVSPLTRTDNGPDYEVAVIGLVQSQWCPLFPF